MEGLGSVESGLQDEGLLVHIPRAHFEAEGHPTLLPVVVLLDSPTLAHVQDHLLAGPLVGEDLQHLPTGVALLGCGQAFRSAQGAHQPAAIGQDLLPLGV